MAIQPINPVSVSFRGTKKTERGNAYHVTHSGRNIGAIAGAASFGIVGKKLTSGLKTPAGKEQLMQALKNIGKSIENFGASPEAQEAAIKKGAGLLVGVVTVAGLALGAAIGGTIDNNKNTKSAKLADKAAKKMQ